MRNLGRVIVILGVAGVALSMAWWATYYNEVVQALGPKPVLTHPMQCLLWTADVCAQPKVAAKLPAYLAPYTPLALWASIGVLLLGLIVGPDSSNYIWRFFCRLTDPFLALIAPLTPKAAAPVVLWLFGVVWLFWLRVGLLYLFLVLGAIPRAS